MPNYANGKIYAIRSKETDEVYIGSTCSTLKDRFSKHKSTHKRKISGVVFRATTASQILKYANAYIELIENCQCETKRDLLDREGAITKITPNCVNTQIQGRTIKQYRIDNNDKLRKQQADYRVKHKAMLKEKYDKWYDSDKGKAYFEAKKAKLNVTVICEVCGSSISKANKGRLQKTAKCVAPAPAV